MTTEETKAETKTPIDSKDDVTKLSDGDIKWRAKYKTTKEELETARAQAESEKQAVLNKITEAERRNSMLETTLIESELAREATNAGIKDTEFLKLIDKAEIKLVDGKVTGADKAINELKNRKPDWFSTEKKTSTSAGAGAHFNRQPASTTPTVDAWSLNNNEFAAAKMKLTQGRYRR